MLDSSRRLWWSIALVLAATIVAGRASRDAASLEVEPPSPSGQGRVVATVDQREPGDALRLYLHRWMLKYNERAPLAQSSASDVSWTPEEPDDFVSVAPVVALTDFETVTFWSATIYESGPISEEHAAYRADFMFWRGNPFSSAGTGAVPLSSTASYDLIWDPTLKAWTITLTSEPPDTRLVESSHAPS